MPEPGLSAVRPTSRRERSALVSEARECAIRAHEGQTRRAGWAPYVQHPLAVAEVVDEAGFDAEVVAAALLHDVVEKTEIGLDELELSFGGRVAELVAAMTEDGSVSPYLERKEEHRRRIEAADEGAAAIYAADKLCNVREVRGLYKHEGEDVARRLKAPLDVRIQLWRGDLEMLTDRAPQIPFLVHLELELRRLDAERAERPAA
jgi:(p)ppGpp synthase/HD superfamily hydrolase